MHYGGPCLDSRTSASQAYVAVAARFDDIGDLVSHVTGALRTPISARLACGHMPAPVHVHEERKALCQLLHALHVQHRVNALLRLLLLVLVGQLPLHKFLGQDKYTQQVTNCN